MSIERIELNNSAMTGYAIPAVQTQPRNYSNKTLERELARREYHSDSVRMEKAAQNQQLKVQAEKSADINRINNKGKNDPAPNISYSKKNTHTSVSYYQGMVGKNIDRTA